MSEDQRLTKKERKQLKKLEKEEERERKEKREKLKKLLWPIIIVGAGVLVLLGIIQVFSLNSDIPSNQELLTIKSSDWIKGNKESKVTLIEYSDFQCPACAFYYNVAGQLMREYGAKIRLVYRHFPLPQHKNARIAAKVAEAAGSKGKFWQMHDMLFENQKIWSEQVDPRGIIVDYAKSFSLDVQKFEEDLDSKEVSDKIENDLKSGESLGINATPTFYLNGKKLRNVASYEELKKMIEDEINKLEKIS